MREFATRPFRLSRLKVAYLYAEVYLRSFWWMIVGIPLFGIVLLSVGPEWLKPLGVVMLFWPIVLPARARFTSWKLGKLLDDPVSFWIEDGYLIFFQSPTQGFKLSEKAVRSVIRCQGHLVFLTHRFKATLPVPIDSFENEGDADTLQGRWLQGKLQKGLNDEGI